MATIKVKVLRGFIDDQKKTLKPGDIVNLSVSLAYQAKDAHKVEFLPDDKPLEAKATKAESAKQESIYQEAPKSEVKAEPKIEAKEEIKEDSKKWKKA